ncbi:MAG: SprB repeat-containing protein, partial [Saprospiraceae bacterium]
MTVQNFIEITIAQFEIIWDSDVLDYINVTNPGSPSINVNADFNLSGPNALKFIPLGFPIDGESQPDGTVLFEVCFRIIGIPGSTSNIGISPYFDFEVADVNGVIPSDTVSCNMIVNPAINLVGFVTSCGPDTPAINGTIDVTVYGGTAPYTITWIETISGTPGGPMVIPAEGGSTVINVPTGNYDVNITDALGSNVTYNIDVVAVQLDVETRLRHPTCYIFKNGTIWIKPLGGEAPYSYIWESLSNPLLAGSGFIRNPGDSSLVTSLPDGSYHIIVEDKNGCRAEITSVLNDNPFIIDVVGLLDATCNGASNGVIDLVFSGATPDASGNYTIITEEGFIIQTDNISLGQFNPGDYCITVEDEVSQCDTIFCFTIGSSTIITANVTVTAPTCAGGNDGMVSIRGLTNGVAGPSYSYAIYQNGILETSATNIGGIFGYSPLNPGIYMAIVSEGPCVSDSISFTIPDTPPIIVSLEGTTIDNCLNTGSGDAWFNISGGNSPYMLETSMGFQDGDTIFNLNSGNYILTVTDDDGCTATLPFRIDRADDFEEQDITFVMDGVPCEQGTTITVLFQGNPIPAGAGVAWSDGQVNDTIFAENPDTLGVDIFLPAPLFCILHDTVIIDCEAQLQLDISVIHPACNDAADGGPYTGSVIVDTLNANPPVNWIWSFGDTTQAPLYTGLAPGKYYVTVTDALDSIAIDSFEIIAPPAIDIAFQSIQATSCADTCDGSLTLVPSGGDVTLPYFMYWTTTTPNADTGTMATPNDLCAGFTKFSVSQDGVCFFSDSAEIISPAPVVLNLVDAIDATCFGYNDGQLEVIASGSTGGYNYTWTGGSSGAINSGLIAGEYYVTVTDANGCSTNSNYNVTQPTVLAVVLTGTKASCVGSVTATPAGGTVPYTYLWNNGATTQTINGIPNGTYT